MCSCSKTHMAIITKVPLKTGFMVTTRVLWIVRQVLTNFVCSVLPWVPTIQKCKNQMFDDVMPFNSVVMCFLTELFAGNETKSTSHKSDNPPHPAFNNRFLFREAKGMFHFPLKGKMLRADYTPHSVYSNIFGGPPWAIDWQPFIHLRAPP